MDDEPTEGYECSVDSEALSQKFESCPHIPIQCDHVKLKMNNLIQGHKSAKHQNSQQRLTDGQTMPRTNLTVIEDGEDLPVVEAFVLDDSYWREINI